MFNDIFLIEFYFRCINKTTMKTAFCTLCTVTSPFMASIERKPAHEKKITTYLSQC